MFTEPPTLKSAQGHVVVGLKWNSSKSVGSVAWWAKTAVGRFTLQFTTLPPSRVGADTPDEYWFDAHTPPTQEREVFQLYGKAGRNQYTLYESVAVSGVRLIVTGATNDEIGINELQA